MVAYRSKSAFSGAGRLTVILTAACFGSGPKRSFVAIISPVEKKRPVRAQGDISVHHYPDRHAGPDSNRGLDLEVASGAPAVRIVGTSTDVRV